MKLLLTLLTISALLAGGSKTPAGKAIETAQAAIAKEPEKADHQNAMALAFARLVSPPATFDKKTRDACARIVRVMSAYPEVIGGTSDRLDTELMRAAPGRLVSKVGAEGVYTAGILPCEEWPGGLGVALKIEDGEDRRARPTVVVETLRQLGVLRDASLEAVSRFAFFPVKNRPGTVVGEVRAAFTLRTPGEERSRTQ